MAPTPDKTTTFSHDVAVAAITRYYQFLEYLHGPGTVKYPPKGGWPEMNPELAQHFNLGPEAFRLIKELPYGQPLQIVPECGPRNYPAGFAGLEATIAKTGKPPPPEYENNPELDPCFPPHIFPLAEGGYRWGARLAIDTKRGVAIWHNENEDHQLSPWPEPDAASEIDFDPDPEAHEPIHTLRGWRSAPTYRIETFFAMAEEHVKLLKWVPMVDRCDPNLFDPIWDIDEEDKARITILRRAGWPGDTWDRDRAVDEIEDWKEEQYKLELAEERMKKATLEANL